MRILDYLKLFSTDTSNSKIRRVGGFRIATTVLAVLSFASLIVTYILAMRTGFFITVVLGIVIYALNSMLERVFNKTILSCMEAEENANIEDSVSLIKYKCYSKYEKYSDYLQKANRFIIVFSAIVATVVVVFGILMLVIDAKIRELYFVITAVGILLYVLVQMIYFVLSLIKENEFFDSCKGEFSLLKKNK